MDESKETATQPTPPSSTPLDLLLNAISGSHHDHPFEQSAAVNGPEPGAAAGPPAEPNGQSGDDDEQDHSIGSLLAASRMIGTSGAQRPENVSDMDRRSRSASSAAHNVRKRPLSPTAPSSSRESKVSKIMAAHLSAVSRSAPTISKESTSRAHDFPSHALETFSTVTVIHGSTGQKSYGNEKRFLLPPPLLRVTGPLLPQLTHVSLSVIPPPAPAQGATETSSAELSRASHTSSSQTYLFPLQPLIPSSILRSTKPGMKPKSKLEAQKLETRLKKLEAKGLPSPGLFNVSALRDVSSRPREELKDGIGFPSLWAKTEDLGKAKSFWLRLSIGKPGVEPRPELLGLETAEKANAEETTLLSQHLQEEESLSLTDEAARAALETLQNSGPADMATALEADYSDVMLGEHAAGGYPDSMDGQHLASSLIGNNASAGPSYSTEQTATNFKRGRRQGTTIPPADPASAWATFISNPINIVSKPSQRTAKARSVANCLTYGSAVSLWVRINSQNARTKFMHVQEAKEIGNVDEKGEDTGGDGIAGGGGRPVLTARTAKWSAFRLDCVRRSVANGNEPAGPTTAAAAAGSLVTYGSIVILTDLITGISSEPLRLTKVDKLLALKEDVGPVSELQKVAFAKVDTEGIPVAHDAALGDWYLSAPSAMVEVADPFKARRRRGRPIADLGKPYTEAEIRSDDDWDHTQGPRPEIAPQEDAGTVTEPSTLDEIPVVGSSFRTIPKTKGKGSAGNGKGKARGKPVLPKTKRNAIALATAAEDRDTSGRTAGLNWAAGKQRDVLTTVSVAVDETRREGQQRRERTKDVMQKAVADEIEDWMIWCIGSVSHFTYTFFDGHAGAGSIPSNPITPCPMLLEEPHLRLESTIDTHTLIVTVTHFHTDDHIPFEVYLGPLGPLRAYAFKSTAPRDKDPYNAGARPLLRAASMDGPEAEVPLVYSSYPSSLPHTVVSIDLPPVTVIINTMRECSEHSVSSDGARTLDGDSRLRTGDTFDPELGLGPGLKATAPTWDEDEQQQMALQEALQNVGHDSSSNALPFGASTSADPMSLDGVFPGEAEPQYQGDPDFPPAGDIRDSTTRDVQGEPASELDQGIQATLGTQLPVLLMPAEVGNRGELTPLPLLFVRASDGAGYSLGKHLTATPVTDRSNYEPTSVAREESGALWEMRVV